MRIAGTDCQARVSGTWHREVRAGLGVAAVAAASLAFPAIGAAQGSGNRVAYDVEFSVQGSLLDPNCTATGTDVLTGTLFGLEPASPHEPNQYAGTLTRTTRISICGSRTTSAGEEVVCRMDIVGRGFADVVLTVEADSAGAWFQYLDDRASWDHLLPPRPQGPSQSTVTGDCDPAEMAELAAEYDEGQTAGSPNGQPVEVLRFPPPASGYPATYAPRPPESIWTLKVLARRQ